MAIQKTRDRFKLQPQEELVIVLDDLDFSWFQGEIDNALQLWENGLSLIEMAERLRSDGDDGQYEVLLLLLHLARQGKLIPRIGGIWGVYHE